MDIEKFNPQPGHPIFFPEQGPTSDLQDKWKDSRVKGWVNALFKVGCSLMQAGFEASKRTLLVLGVFAGAHYRFFTLKYYFSVEITLLSVSLVSKFGYGKVLILWMRALVGTEITVVVFVILVVVTAADEGIGVLTFGTSFNILNN